MSRLKLGETVIDIYEPDTANGRAVLFCHGFPGGIGPLPGVVFCLRLGFTVIFPQYPGSYDSDGTFSPKSASRAISDVIDQQGRDGIPRIDSLVAHSYGALIGCTALGVSQSASIRRALLLAPVLSYRSQPDSGTREDLLDHVAGVRATRPRTYRVATDDAWSAVATGEPPLPQEHGWAGNVLSLVGDGDDTFDIGVLSRVHSSLVRDLVSGAKVTFSLVKGAGHGMDEILAQDEPASSFLQG